MDVELRNVREEDLDGVLCLNQSELPHVGSITAERLRWFAENACYFRVAIVDKALAAFLIGLRPGTEYDSPNYRWFCQRYKDFAYVDRVAVAEFSRRLGLASRLYTDFANSMPRVPIMACEVNIEPPNDASMVFHQRLGFEQVGSQFTEAGTKQVAMLVKTLPNRDRG